MVSNITPGTTGAGAGALGVDPRYARAKATNTEAGEAAAKTTGDRVEVSDAAAWSAARESVRTGLAQLSLALGAGQEAQGLIAQVQSLAQSGDQSDAAKSDLKTLLDQIKQRIDDAVAEGARLLAGEDLSVQAEPGAPAVSVAGADARVPQASDTGLSLASSLDDPDALSNAAERSRAVLQGALDRFSEAARALTAHQGFLGAVEGAKAGGDLDADAARLLALQVRQGLDAAGGAAIANVEPTAVLALFRA